MATFYDNLIDALSPLFPVITILTSQIGMSLP
jgi:hypothetical protein